MFTNFKINTERTRHSQSFDKDTIEIKKAGKTINVYQMIQENREDTEIYPTLEKYGSIERMKLDSEGTYADLRNIKDLRNSIEQVQQADVLWQNLPLDTRREFGHSKKEFIEKGENWLKNKIEASKPKVEVEQPKVQEGVIENA